MNHTMSYKGYTASVSYNEKESCYIGRVIGIAHIIVPRGSTLSEFREDFEEMIDWYLEDCEKDGIGPDKPPTEIMIPFPTELYAQAYCKAESAGVPIQQLILETVQQSIS
jgi:predicted HicB family RNase H-like nuclease